MGGAVESTMRLSDWSIFSSLTFCRILILSNLCMLKMLLSAFTPNNDSKFLRKEISHPACYPPGRRPYGFQLGEAGGRPGVRNS